MSQPLTCDSPQDAPDLCSSLMQCGSYSDSTIEIPPVAPLEGLVLFQPTTETDPNAWALLQAGCAETGYRIARARTMSGRDIRQHGKARSFLQAELDIAATGRLYAAEWLRLLQIYDRPEFRQIHGVRPGQLAVQPAMRMLDQSSRSALELSGWCREKIAEHGLDSRRLDALNAIGDCKVVFLLEAGDRPPVFLLNPHVLAILAEYEDPGRTTCAFHVRPARSDCRPWHDLVARVTDRFGPLCRISRGAADAVHDLWAWFALDPQDTAVGQRLLEDTRWQPHDLLGRPYLDYLGERRVFRELARGMNVEQARELLMAGRLVEAPGSGARPDTLRRVELAFEEADDVARQSQVLCVIASGSVARDRCSHDSDLDLAVIVDDEAGPRRIDSCRRGGIAVDRDWIPKSEALALVSQSTADVKGLRESSRLGSGLVVYDRAGLSDTFRRAASEQLPPRADLQQRLSRAFLTLSHAIDNCRDDASQAWETLRSIYDNVTFVALVLHPIRYQKPKWIVSDLAYTGNDLLLQGLLEAYGVDDSFRLARQTIEASRQFLRQIAESLQLPGYEEIIAMGYAPQYAELSFACRCHADAGSLLCDGRLSDAQYTAKFAARLGVGLLEHAQIERGGAEPAAIPGPLEILERHGDGRLVDGYRDLFDIGRRAAPEDEIFMRCYEAADACRRFYRGKYRLDPLPDGGADER
jgi:hypothetical protein